MTKSLQELREDYRKGTLLKHEVASDPIEQFRQWFDEATQAQIPEPNAMILATSTSDGRPSARVVLLKGVEDHHFVFYTNYESQKGQELAQNPYAALVFNWLALERQIRISGKCIKISEEDSTAYFQSRPKGSQIGAWTSPQSQVIDTRTVLDDKKTALDNEYEHTEVLPRPPHWGGYGVIPEEIEFWQGRSNRLHDRIRYRKEGGNWIIERLAP